MEVVFHLAEGAWHGNATETLWGTPLNGNRVRIENSPFFVFGISYRDIVRVERLQEKYVFQCVILHGGHSTYRMIKTCQDEGSFERY